MCMHALPHVPPKISKALDWIWLGDCTSVTYTASTLLTALSLKDIIPKPGNMSN